MTTPSSTYRVQFRPEFGFDDAVGIVGYLSELGISHLYASPYFQAVPGSTHGYDVVDHSRVNDELGGALAHARMVEALHSAGMGHILDIVPNHMAIPARENQWWWDVLENGPLSPYAAYFDIDWDPPPGKLRETVLAPILGDHYGRVLEAGEIQVERDERGVIVRYYDNELPLDPRSLVSVVEALANRFPRNQKIQVVSRGLESLAEQTHLSAGHLGQEALRERHRTKQAILQSFRECLEDAEVAQVLEEELAAIGSDADRLDALLSQQNYRLAFWRTAGTELDYRRFFDINTLVALRAEREDVFDETHQLILEWIDNRTLDGVRVDHIDGLRDPLGYLRRLRARAGPDTWIVVEKILEAEERLPASWPIAGTTGYDAMYRIGGLFVEPDGEIPITDFYSRFTNEQVDWSAVVREGKSLVLTRILGSDLSRLTNLFVDVCESHRRYRDYSRDQLQAALAAVLVAFPVYRSYAVADTKQVTRTDEDHVGEAVRLAAEQYPDLDTELLDLLAEILTLKVDGDSASELVMRFQQLSGPVMAKGVEDTAFYRYNRLITLNEVGGDPGHFAVRPDDFHEACSEAQRLWPQTLVASTTHDTKRSEDVRNRIALLSEMPKQWAEAVERWSAINERHRVPVHPNEPFEERYPDRNIEYLMYETMVGAFPVSTERLSEYASKASKEAKVHTSWTDTNPAYDHALGTFVEAIGTNVEFMADLGSFVTPLVEPGRINSLAALLIKLTCPGVPDIYQGTELWELTLVDPDNRRPVDYDLRRTLLTELDGMPPDMILSRADEGLPKLHVLRQALDLRRRRPECFDGRSDYRPVLVTGSKALHTLAFARKQSVVTVVPRLILGAQGDWKDARIEVPEGRWKNLLTGQVFDGDVLKIADLFAHFPVSLLEAQGSETGSYRSDG